MTFNSVIALILLYFTESMALQAYFVTVVEDRLMLSAQYCLPLLAKTDPPSSAVSAIAELRVQSYCKKYCGSTVLRYMVCVYFVCMCSVRRFIRGRREQFGYW